MKFAGAVIGWLLLTSATHAAQDWTVSLKGAGPLRIGMSLGAVRRILSDRYAHLVGNDPAVPLGTCAYLESERLPKGLGLMFAKGRIVRIDVHQGDVKTISGVAIGDREDRVLKLFPGRIRIEKHQYDPEGHYLYYSPAGNTDRAYGIVFETDGTRVTSFRCGTLVAIALVEGCV